MKFKEKYTYDKTKEEEKEKIEISKDSYAICEVIEELINKIEHARVSLISRR